MRRGLQLSLQSRVGRRIVMLFVVSALLPVGALAFLGYAQVRRQLAVDAEGQLAQAAKAVGMGLVDQLRAAHAAMMGAGATLPGEIFAAVRDSAPPGITLPARAAAALAEGRVTLAVTDADTAPVWIVAPGQGGRPRWASVRATFLAAGAAERGTVNGGETRVCVRAGRHRVIGCGAADSSDTQFEAAWTVFLGYDYDAPSWRVVVSQPASVALAPLSSFRRTFAATLVAVLGLVVALSISQVRSNLQPLQELERGTRRLAEGDFSHPVVVKSGDEFEDLATSFNSMTGELDRQFQANAALITRLDQLSYGALAALARAVDASSHWTAGHSERVTSYSLRMAMRLGIDGEMLDALHRGGLLHDLGKVGISPDILDKPGLLNEREIAIIREHPAVGARILAPLAAFADAIPVVLHHHERFDGQGYPHQLRGPAIPLLARLLSVADVYDALVSNRPYRVGWPQDRALDNIRDGSGSQFDPVMVEAFFGVMESEGDAARFTLSLERSA